MTKRGNLDPISWEAWQVRPSLRAIVGVFLRIFTVALAIIVAISFPGLQDANSVAEILWVVFLDQASLVIAFFAAFFPIAQIAFTTYTIDKEGVRVRTKILSLQDHLVPWSKVTALLHRRTFIDRIFGIERVTVIAYGARGATVQLVGLRDGPAVRDLASAALRRHCTVTALQAGD